MNTSAGTQSSDAWPLPPGYCPYHHFQRVPPKHQLSHQLHQTCLWPVAMIAIVNNDSNTEGLREWFRTAIGCIIFWFIFGPIWTLLFFRRSA